MTLSALRTRTRTELVLAGDDPESEWLCWQLLVGFPQLFTIFFWNVHMSFATEWWRILLLARFVLFFFFCSFFTCSPLRPPLLLRFCVFVIYNFPGDGAQIQQPPSEDLNRRQLECIHKYGRKFSGKFCNLDVFRDFNAKEEEIMREPLQLALRPSHCRLSHVYLSQFAVCLCVFVRMCEAEFTLVCVCVCFTRVWRLRSRIITSLTAEN